MLFKTLFVCSLTFGSLCYADAKADAELKVIRERFHGPSIRVQLLQDTDGALVEVKGRYNVYDPKTGKKEESAFFASSYYMYPTRDGLKWGAEFPGVYQLLLVPDKTDTTVLVAGTEYRGIAYLYQIDGTLGAVNEVSLEDFVHSVLSTHLPTYVTKKEAIAAAAILLRTQAIRLMEQAKNPYWDVKAGMVGYRGFSVERRYESFEEALKITRGMIATKNSLPLDISWFTAGDAKAPFQEMQSWAEQGKDARAIIEQLFPGCIITKISSKK